MADAGRPNQKSRTRKDLLRAASRLMQAGRSPTLDEVAAEAMVSRATAYRYFPGVEALLTEAALDVAMPEAGTFFADDPSAEPLERLLRADAAVIEMIRANEPALRAMLVHSLQQGLAGGGALPTRQNRRTPLIEAALAPAPFAPWIRDRLARALALVIGTESLLAFKDVLQLADDEADSVRRWMIRALVEAARRA
ncbi:MAG TPA: helix-turn-helix domain-containing protein [Allosphingosinicella sp.]|nr:helix-turn-helix domain-containing protein [Allosphingosinicella sp.]